MNKSIYILIAALWLCCSCSSNDEPNGFDGEEAPTIEFSSTENEVCSQLNKFSFKFLSTISENYADIISSSDENINISPISAAFCLSMMANAYDDSYRQKFAKIIGYNDINTLNNVCYKLLKYLPERSNGAELFLSNSIWYNKSIAFNQNYMELMKTNFNANPVAVNMADEKGTLKLINDWAAKSTHNMIPQILDCISKQTAIIWANALYFNGTWKKKIDKSLSKERTFNGSLRQSKVNMMETLIETRYSSDNDYQMISIPFQKVTQLILVMPRQDMNISNATTELTYDRWQSLCNSSYIVEATIHFPSFDIGQELNLCTALDALGIPTTNINFENAGIKDPCQIQATQYTSTTINEEGAKAAATTVIYGLTSSGISKTPKKIEITFDRPFMYFIKNSRTGSIIMAGRVANL